MTDSKQRLFDAFRADHALLGSGIHVLGECIRQGDWDGARSMAAKISHEAGPHIAFEEEDFYPALGDFIERRAIEEMYEQHEMGRLLIKQILTSDISSLSESGVKDELLANIHDLENHVTDCGELFGVMRGLENRKIDKLLEKLQRRQLDSPDWLDRSPVRGLTGQTRQQKAD